MALVLAADYDRSNRETDLRPGLARVTNCSYYLWLCQSDRLRFLNSRDAALSIGTKSFKRSSGPLFSTFPIFGAVHARS